MRKLLPLLLLLCFCSPAFAQDSTQTARRVVVGVTNEGVTGTTANRLAKLTGAPSKAIIVATTDTEGTIGVVVSNGATSGLATIQTAGLVNCDFDAATVAGDYVSISSTTAGKCHDAGATRPTTGQIIGRALSTNDASGTYQLVLALGTGTPATALADPGGNGYVVRTGAGVTAARMLTGTTIYLTNTNGDGSVGNPVFNIGANVAATDRTNTFGAFVQTFQGGANHLIVDPTDTSKKFQFDVSNVSTATTRTMNVPNAN